MARCHRGALIVDPEARDHLVAGFAAWLDEILQDESPPEGLPAELLAEIAAGGGETTGDEPDLYRLQSAMTALAQEVKLQGRAFDRLGSSLGGITELPGAVEAALASHHEAVQTALLHVRTGKSARGDREAVQQARRELRLDMLEVQMDLRDRLLRGLAACEDHLARAKHATAASWMLRLWGGPLDELIAATEALHEGSTLALQRLDQHLAESGVSELPCAGRPFDPTCMRAVAVEAGEGWRPGEVIEVLRRGYRDGDEILRHAEVRVAGNPSGENHPGPPEGLLEEPGATS